MSGKVKNMYIIYCHLKNSQLIIIKLFSIIISDYHISIVIIIKFSIIIYSVSVVFYTCYFYGKY